MDIYSVNNWATATLYKKNAIVINNNFYYYAKQTHTSSNFASDLNNGLWDGVINYAGVQYPYFFWKTSYDYNTDVSPLVKSIKYGDGYSQDIADGLNNILLPINLNFDDRGLDETTAILHFLHARNGTERFIFVPPAPYNISKKFVCQKWSSTQKFVERYKISAIFEERVA